MYQKLELPPQIWPTRILYLLYQIEALIKLTKLHLIATDIGTKEGQGKGHETMGLQIQRGRWHCKKIQDS